MASQSKPPCDNHASESLTLKTGWGWVLAYGALVILIGVLALLNPAATGFATGVFLGMALLTYGILALAAGLSPLSLRGRWIEILLGILSVLAAVITFFDPFSGALTLVALIGAWLFIIGVFEIIGAFRSVHDRIWRLLLGALDAVLGGVLLFSNPATGLAFLALAVGLSFLFRGTFLVLLALSLRRIEKLSPQ
jgi:uncharacterized membrane protein HdeD (DUF308 family)